MNPRALYEGDYFTGEEYLDYLADEAFFRRNFARRLARLREYCAGGRLLEIGAAYGFFLDVSKPHFEGLGFEVNPAAVDHARGQLRLDVRTDDFLAISPESLDGNFDAAVMWDVIEHLERPDLFLQRIAGSLRPQGVLMLTTGDIGSLVARLRGRRWRMIHPPSHLHYFSRDTLSRLLTRCGFEVVDIRTEGVARSWRQVLYSILVLRLGRPKLYQRVAACIPPTWGFTLDLFDIMAVTAKRTPVF